MEQQYEELLAAYKKESNPKTKERMLAVINVLVHGEAIPTVSRFFRKAYNSIKNWIRRFDENRIDVLSEKPRSGRRPKISNHKITEYLADKLDGIFPKVLARDIKKKEKVRYTESGIRDMLRRRSFTPKVPDAIHKRKATISEIEQWQKELKPWISCVKRDGFELFVQDEVWLEQDGKLKSGPWSPKGQKIHRVYFGDHQKRVIYGAISENYQYFLRRRKFNGSTFLQFMKHLLKRRDKVAILLDAAPQHNTKAFKKFIKDNSKRLRVRYFLTGTPEHNEIEERWHQLKIQSFMYEYHEHISDRAAKAMKFLNNTKFNTDIEKYLFRTPIAKTF